MKIDILTLFPEMFSPVTEHSIIGRAAAKGILEIRLTDIRDHTLDRHNKTDDTPFGGGAGMIMSAEPIFRSLESIDAKGSRIIYLSPKGRLLNGELIKELAEEDRLTLLCGHYEGIDQRVLDYWDVEEISVGDYILSGGELPAMILIDGVGRLLPGVLGNNESHKEESIYSGLLEYPQYTKPREYKGMKVPEILLSGDHRKIQLWRFEQALRLTKSRRFDLFEKYSASIGELGKKEKSILKLVQESTTT